MKHGGDIYSDAIEYDFSVNLNPMDCSDVIEEIMEDSHTKLGNYPDPLQREFREAIALMEGVSVEEVYGGNGASELLMALTAMINPAKVLILNPTFAGYRHALSVLNECNIVEYTLQEDKEYVLDRIFLGVLEFEAKNGLELLFLTNPNNPTGKIISAEVLDEAYRICRDNNVKMIVDECFIRMSKDSYSMTKYINEYDGLFVVNAFTKLFSIPGVRVGYVVSNKDNIAELANHLPEWNMSTIAQSAGVICSKYVREHMWEKRTLEVIAREREYLTSGLRELGFKVFDSDTVFVLFCCDEDLYDYLKARKILIRDCSNFEGLRKGFYRVAIKNHQANEILLQTLNARNK